jgi:hypothetical protein
MYFRDLTCSVWKILGEHHAVSWKSQTFVYDVYFPFSVLAGWIQTEVAEDFPCVVKEKTWGLDGLDHVSGLELLSGVIDHCHSSHQIIVEGPALW